jgi:hypothetical protein
MFSSSTALLHNMLVMQQQAPVFILPHPFFTRLSLASLSCFLEAHVSLV